MNEKVHESKRKEEEAILAKEKMEREIEKLRKDLHESRQQIDDLHEQLALERKNIDRAKMQGKAALRDTSSETIGSVKGKEKEKRQRSMMSVNETLSEAQEKLKAYD